MFCQPSSSAKDILPIKKFKSFVDNSYYRLLFLVNHLVKETFFINDF